MTDGREKSKPKSSSDPLDMLRTEVKGVAAQLKALETQNQQLLDRQIVYLDDAFVAIRTPLGWIVIPQEEQWLLIHFANGRNSHEPGTVKVIEALLEAGDTAVDVGAHIGLLALPIARSIGATGHLIALEPVPRNANSLRRTLSSNGVDPQCEIVEAAASDEDGTCTYYLGVNSMMASLVAGPGEQLTAQARSVKLDNIIKAGLPVSFVKIDAEGFETRVLAGMSRIIAENPDICVIAEFGPYHLEKMGINPHDWFADFAKQGFVEYLGIDETSGQCSKVSVDQLLKILKDAMVPSCNVLFSKSGSEKVKRLASLIVSVGESNQ